MAFTEPEKVALTTAAVIENVALDAVAGTVTEAGTEAWVFVLVRVITTPPAGAGPASVTLPIAIVPLGIADGVTDSAVRITGPETVSAKVVDGMPFAITSSVEIPVSVDAGSVKFVEVGVRPVATPIVL